MRPIDGDELSDLISRQAAINAVEFGIKYVKVISEETALLREVNAELEKASDRIKQLPYTCLEPSQVPHWHPVSEMPEEDDDYLLLTHEKTKYGTFKRIIIGAWNSATNEWLEEYEGMYRDVNHPVAWISMQELLLLKGYEATE